MCVAYEGEFYVEDDEFQLRAERLIVCKDKPTISFRFEGIDYNNNSYGPFSVESVAEPSSLGYLVAGDCRIKYDNYSDPREDGRVEIRLIQVTPSGDRCKVKGEWREGGLCWEFRKKLKPFRRD